MHNFYTYTPDKFTNVTNGITQRRWLLTSNPKLAALITDAIGSNWIEYPCDLAKLAPLSKDTAFLEDLASVKLHNKLKLAKYIKEKHGIIVDVHSIFDSHIKRIHAYKRQCLNVMHIMHLYHCLRENPQLDIPPVLLFLAARRRPVITKQKKLSN